MDLVLKIIENPTLETLARIADEHSIIELMLLDDRLFRIVEELKYDLLPDIIFSFESHSKSGVFQLYKNRQRYLAGESSYSPDTDVTFFVEGKKYRRIWSEDKATLINV